MNAETAKWAFVGGLLAVFMGSYVMFVIYQAYVRGQFTTAWIAAEVALLVAGATLGVFIFKLELLANPSLRTFGFPFVAGVFELHDGLWTEYVGPLTLPTCIANFLVGLMVAQIPMALVLKLYLWTRSKSAHA